jgi:hypothetical protein
MDIGAAYNSRWHQGKDKGKTGHQKGKGEHQGKGYSSSYNNKGKRKGGYPIGQGNPFQQGSPFKGASKGKGKYPPNNMKGKEKSKGKGTCYKCGQQGHIARNCRVSVYSVGNDEHQQWENDPSNGWYQDQYQQGYDQGWYNQDCTQQGYERGYQPPAASSQSPPPASTTPTGMA